MGQKTNPISNRIGITRGWDSNWVGGNYAEKIAEDYEIRKYLGSRLAKASLSRIIIERTLKLVTVTIHAARPGVIIGKGSVDGDGDELQGALDDDAGEAGLREAASQVLADLIILGDLLGVVAATPVGVPSTGDTDSVGNRVSFLSHN